MSVTYSPSVSSNGNSDLKVAPQVSVIVPIYNEVESLEALVSAIAF